MFSGKISREVQNVYRRQTTNSMQVCSFDSMFSSRKVKVQLLLPYLVVFV